MKDEPRGAICEAIHRGRQVSRAVHLVRVTGLALERLARFRGAAGLCDQLGGRFCGLGLDAAASGGAISDATRRAVQIMERLIGVTLWRLLRRTRRVQGNERSHGARSARIASIFCGSDVPGIRFEVSKCQRLLIPFLECRTKRIEPVHSGAFLLDELGCFCSVTVAVQTRQRERVYIGELGSLSGLVPNHEIQVQEHRLIGLSASFQMHREELSHTAADYLIATPPKIYLPIECIS